MIRASWFARHADIVSVLLIVLAWEVVGQWGLLNVLPPLSQIVRAGWQLIVTGRLGGPIRAFVVPLLVGYGLAIVVGICVGVAMSQWRYLDEVMRPYVDAAMTAPIAAIVPILVTIFGTGGESTVAIAFLFSVFVVIVNTYTGAKNVDVGLLQMADSLHASRSLILRRIVIPNALPFMLAGLRIALGRGVNGAVFGQMLISIVGIGGLLMMFGSRFQYEQLYALTFLVSGGTVGLMFLLEKVEQRLLGERFERRP